VAGQYERQIHAGVALFQLRFLESAVPLSITFVSGHWRLVEVLNTTYWRNPTFRALSTKVGDAKEFLPGPFLFPRSTCTINSVVSTTRITLVNDPLPKWVPNDEPFLVEFASTNVAGVWTKRTTSRSASK